jgi:TPR repeat protein
LLLTVVSKLRRTTLHTSWIKVRLRYVAMRDPDSFHDIDKTGLRWGLFSPEPPSNKSAQLALLHWTRSAGQGDVDAMVKLGDYYYHGLGVNEPNVLLKEKAAGYYQSAIETIVPSRCGT